MSLPRPADSSIRIRSQCSGYPSGPAPRSSRPREIRRFRPSSRIARGRIRIFSSHDSPSFRSAPCAFPCRRTDRGGQRDGRHRRHHVEAPRRNLPDLASTDPAHPFRRRRQCDDTRRWSPPPVRGGPRTEGLMGRATRRPRRRDQRVPGRVPRSRARVSSPGVPLAHSEGRFAPSAATISLMCPRCSNSCSSIRRITFRVVHRRPITT